LFLVPQICRAYGVEIHPAFSADAADFIFHHLRKSAKSADAFPEAIPAAESAA
jgi:hypothetical protein